MVFHPPLLYMGYVGFSVAFAFAIAALIGGRLDATWARWSRPWTTLAWCFSPAASCSAARGRTTSSAGAAGGSGTRSRTRRSCRGSSARRSSTRSRSPRSAGRSRRGPCCSRSARSRCRCSARSSCAPACSRRCTRSRTDPRRGVFILAFLALVIGGSLALFALRAPKVGGGGRFDADFARDDAAREQRAADRRGGLGAARHALSAFPRRAEPRQDLGRPAVLRHGVRSADDAARLPDGRRTARALEAGEPFPTCGSGCDGRSRSASSRRSCCRSPPARGRRW